ncbi:MAG: NAD(P)(+) transhydrogenase (Re/Si-specific) subunit alpha, partial [Acidobacteria bacterium]|nr:NAD(P)(+) transhydrogenase (Re/Si-specific) subunit alpha [Acidobacteriota bacterium]
MQISVLKETDANEARVALVPESVKKLVAMNVTIAVERGAGLRACI